jgi:hypothetical protein
MPARDGTGPLGQGSRTGRGMGKCNSPEALGNQTGIPVNKKPFHWGGRVWDAMVGRLFGRRRANRTNRK